MMSQNTERRKIQRDWVGHILQLLVILVLIGIPLSIWGTNLTTTMAILIARVDRSEKDISQQQQIQNLTTGQLIDVNKQLTKIDVLLDTVKNDLKSRK